MHYNYINLFTNIKDTNITFHHSNYESINNIQSILTHATLDYLPSSCPHCGVTNPKLLSKGYQKPSLITLNKSANFNSYLKLKKKRYTCLECNRSFTLSTNEVNKYCFISNNVKTSIALNLTKAYSMKDIACDNNVSFNTVSRVLHSEFDAHKHKIERDYLPDTLLFDEFKSVKNTCGKMSFLFLDAKTHKIIDIVENRQLSFLKNYFKRYTKKARDSVKSIVIDMYTPYIELIKTMFINAKIVFDKFHIIQHINRALNKARIDLMKTNKNNYNKLKRYWKLILTNRNKLNNSKYKKSRCFGRMITDKQIVDYLVNLDQEFKDTYEYYQDIMNAIEIKNKDSLRELLNEIPNDISIRMKQALKFVCRNSEYALNCIDSEYTNGPIEGTNNKIKLIKRISYGFRSFINFKLRIMLHFNLIKKA